MNALEAQRVGFSYGTELLFEDFGLSVRRGEFVGVIGPNGSGKSTLLRLLAGLLHPQAGTVLLLGREVGDMGRREIARSVAVVPQESHFGYDYPVEEVVMMGRYPYLGRWQQPGPQDVACVTEAMRTTDTRGLAAKSVNEISGGEKQRVVVARALAQEPEVLMLDEATSHLDICHQQSVVRVLRELNRAGTTVIMLSHDLNLAGALCERLVLLDRGKLAACDTPERVLDPDLIASVYGVRPLVVAHPETGRPQVLLPSEAVRG